VSRRFVSTRSGRALPCVRARARDLRHPLHAPPRVLFPAHAGDPKDPRAVTSNRSLSWLTGRFIDYLEQCPDTGAELVSVAEYIGVAKRCVSATSLCRCHRRRARARIMCICTTEVWAACAARSRYRSPPHPAPSLFPRSRLYDITNVLEGVGLLEKRGKNTIVWRCVARRAGRRAAHASLAAAARHVPPPLLLICAAARAARPASRPRAWPRLPCCGASWTRWTMSRRGWTRP